MLFSIYADDKILSPNISQKKFIQYMKKDGWILVEEKLNGKEFVNNKIEEYKNYFWGVWNFDGYDNPKSSFCGFSCKILSAEFLTGYLSRICFVAEDNNLLLEIENLNEALYYTQDGNEFRFIKSDNQLTVYYKINEKNTHYSRKLNS